MVKAGLCPRPYGEGMGYRSQIRSIPILMLSTHVGMSWVIMEKKYHFHLLLDPQTKCCIPAYNPIPYDSYHNSLLDQ